MIGNVFILMFAYEIKFFNYIVDEESEQKVIREIHSFKKPLGYSVFEGYSKDHFYFYNRDTKD